MINITYACEKILGFNEQSELSHVVSLNWYWSVGTQKNLTKARPDISAKYNFELIPLNC